MELKGKNGTEQRGTNDLIKGGTRPALETGRQHDIPLTSDIAINVQWTLRKKRRRILFQCLLVIAV